MAPVATWLSPLIFSALNRSSSHRYVFESSSGHMWDKPSSACGCGQVVFLKDLPFLPHLSIDGSKWVKYSWQAVKLESKKKKKKESGCAEWFSYSLSNLLGMNLHHAVHRALNWSTLKYIRVYLHLIHYLHVVKGRYHKLYSRTDKEGIWG